TLAEQNPQRNARQRRAVRQSIRWDSCPNFGCNGVAVRTSVSKPRSSERDLEKPNEKYAITQDGCCGHRQCLLWLRSGLPRRSEFLRRGFVPPSQFWFQVSPGSDADGLV